MENIYQQQSAVYREVNRIYDMIDEYGPHHDEYEKITFHDCYDLLDKTLDMLRADLNEKQVVPQVAATYFGMAMSNMYYKNLIDHNTDYKLDPDDEIRSYLLSKAIIDSFVATQHRKISLRETAPMLRMFPYFAEMIKCNMNKFDIADWVTRSNYARHGNYEDVSDMMSATDTIMHMLSKDIVTRKIIHDRIVNDSQSQDRAVQWDMQENHALLTYKNVENNSIEFIYGLYEDYTIKDYNVIGAWGFSTLDSAARDMSVYFKDNDIDVTHAAQQYDFYMLDNFVDMLRKKKAELNTSVHHVTNPVVLCNAQKQVSQNITQHKPQ